LRSSYLYDDEAHLLQTLQERKEQALQLAKTRPSWHDIWNLSLDEVDILIALFQYRENFTGQLRIDCPVADFYTNQSDYIKIAEDTGLYPEITVSATDTPNTIIVTRLPYETFQLKCLTRYARLDKYTTDALLEYEGAGEIRFPWTWSTRRFILEREDVVLPEYLYALNDESLTFVSLIAGDVIGTVYNYKVEDKQCTPA
tara:strand:+ start:468 stop:1067 length:600 start_codon:yes stop_codon:yes gene_type:complete